MIDAKTARQPLDERQARQEFLLWLLCYDNVVRGEYNQGATTAFTKATLRLAFMFGHERKRLEKMLAPKRELLFTMAELEAAGRKMAEVWLKAAEACQAKAMRHVTFTAQDMAVLKEGYAFLRDHMHLLTVGAWHDAHHFVNTTVEEHS